GCQVYGFKKTVLPTPLTDPPIRAAYSAGAGIYRIVPRAVVIPRTPEQLSQVLVREAGRSFVPRGAGSGMPGGNVGADVVVDCSSLKGLTLDPDRRIARAGAGVTWKEVNDAAEKVGLRLPPDPSSGAFATSGGMVSTNAAGPRTVRYGSMRRWVVGLEVVEADGTVRSVARGQPSAMFTLTAADRRLVAEPFPKT